MMFWRKYFTFIRLDKLLAFFPDFLKTGGHVGFMENYLILKARA